MANNLKLPARSASATVDKMFEIRRRLADLSAYIVHISEGGAITLQSLKINTVCVTLPPPTGLVDAVSDERLAKALAAVGFLNQAIDNGDELQYARLRTACVNPVSGDIDEALTARVMAMTPDEADAARAALGPPSLLPQLGPEQIKLQIGNLRRELADLAQFIDKILADKEGPVVYFFDYGAGAVLAEETPLEGKTAKEPFGMAQDAIRLMNTGLRSGGFRWDKTPA